LPPTLFIKLARFVQHPREAKLPNRVNVPDTVDMAAYLLPAGIDARFDTRDEAARGTQYELYAAVVHDGVSVHGGHYYAYVKVDGVWYRFNDATATRLSARPDLSAAYGLFFTRK